ncbi:MAG: YfiR family protein [Burkholderiaceae bacterium]|nr:YfiR family protein [Burkholderiaceae bacterium]
MLKISLLAILSFHAGVRAQSIDGVQEYRLKAAFIYNFSQFIEWPAGSFASPDSPFPICVVGDDPFGDALLALQKRSYQGRRIVISYPKTAAEARSCRILYVDNPLKTAQWREFDKVLSDVPVLTVSSGEDVVSSGICIGFVPREGKIRWTLNLGAARRAQLKISAKLIEIAVAIVGETTR